MSNPQQPGTLRIIMSILVPFIWLVLLALWLFLYAGSYSLIQNLGIFVISVAIAGLLEVLIWVPWSMKHYLTD